MVKQSNLGATLKALLAAWVALVFGTSLLIFLFAPIEQNVYSSNAIINMLSSVWELGDAMGPAVKISLILIFSVLTLGFQNWYNQPPISLYLKSILFALIATILVLGFLPADYSRGFGIGLTSSRFDEKVLHLYFLGAFLGGLTYAYTFSKLSRNNS